MSRPLRIYQIAEGYCYNSDSLFLWDFIRPHIRRGIRILDLGSGSGVVGLLCARDGGVELFGIDRQRAYALLASKNALSNKIPATFIAGEALELLKPTSLECLIARPKGASALSLDTKSLWQSFDFVVSNPPFYSYDKPHNLNPLKAQAKQSMYLPLELLLKSSRKILKPGGNLFLCYPAWRLCELAIQLGALGFSLHALRFVHPRASSESKLLLAHARRQSSQAQTQTRLLPPLLTHEGEKQDSYTKEVLDLYRRARAHSIKVSIDDILWDRILES